MNPRAVLGFIVIRLGNTVRSAPMPVNQPTNTDMPRTIRAYAPQREVVRNLELRCKSIHQYGRGGCCYLSNLWFPQASYDRARRENSCSSGGRGWIMRDESRLVFVLFG